jgi:hypothetical protein
MQIKNNIFQSITMICKPMLLNTITRSMRTSRSIGSRATHLTPNSRMNSTTYLRNTRHSHNMDYITRNYFGQFRVIKYDKDTVQQDGSKIPNHEWSHLKLQDMITGKVVGLFTSQPENKKTGEVYQFVSKEKHDGTVLPDTNPDGSPNNEGQHISVLENPRSINDYHVIKPQENKQNYVDKHEETIKKIIITKKQGVSLGRKLKIDKPDTPKDEGF